MSKMRIILQSNKGSIPFMTLVIIFVLLTFSATIMELYRIHSIQSHIEHELQRAVNIAVEDAMHDSWRQDKYNKMDVALALRDLEDYLRNDLELNNRYEKTEDGKTVYQIEFSSREGTEEPPRLFVSGTLKMESVFNFLVDEIRIPFSIASRNFREDGN